MDDAAQKAAAAANAMAAKDDQAQLTKNPTPTLADDVEDLPAGRQGFEEKQQDYQVAYNAGGHFKEQLEAISKSWRSEQESRRVEEREIKNMEEIPGSPEVGPEMEGYIEKVEKDPELQKALADDYIKTIGMQSATTQNPQVTLPLTNSQVQAGLHHKVWEAVRWLAVWCLRQMKMVSLKRA